MPSYLQLAQEQVWQDQYVPDNLTRLLIEPLREFYNMGAASIGAPGDNSHLYGRHRSAAWDRTSAFCTDRSYGTTDARDHEGDQDIYRAVDVGIQGEVLYASSHRMDELVRSGKCPGVAEWFGTFDGQTVVGWYEGGPSSSDDSHLWHIHVGFWNASAEDPATLQAVLAAITGQKPDQGDDDMLFVGQADNGKTFWVGDGFYHRQLADANTAKTLAAAAKTDVLNYGPNTTAAQLLAIIGPTPHVATASGDRDTQLLLAAINGVPKATADEIAADPERDGAGT
jgi:hypothetical protein